MYAIASAWYVNPWTVPSTTQQSPQDDLSAVSSSASMTCMSAFFTLDFPENKTGIVVVTEEYELLKVLRSIDSDSISLL